MNELDYDHSSPSSGLGAAALLLGLAVGAAALLLSTKPGQMLWAQMTDRAEDWKAQAAATVAETREKVVSSVEAETSGYGDSDSQDGSSRVRERL